MTENAPVDVCIVGAGPVGATLACRLAAGGARVALVDRARLPPMERPEFDGRAYAIAAGSRRLLTEAGVWPNLPLPACPILDIRVSDGRVGRPASPLHLHFDHRETGSGPFGWMVEARSLRVALNRTLHAAPGLLLHAPDTAEVRRETDHATVTLGSGAQFRARLVIAAEGRESTLRQQAGIGTVRVPYRQRGLVTAIAHTRPHHGVALEHFLPGGPFAQLPMIGAADASGGAAPHVSAIVWTERAGLAERMHALPEPAYAREIARRLGGHLGEVRPIGRRWLYNLGALHATRYTDTRLALVGDAAHAIHPIAGQGLNLGFRDAIALSGLLLAALAEGHDPGAPALLARYQRARRPDNLAMLAATDALDRLFSTDRGAVRLVRDLGIAAVHRMPGLKRAFVARAMGA